jgi:hypothetical protein
MASICQGGGVRGRRGRRWRTPRVSMEDIGGHRWRMTSGVAVGGSRGQKGGAVGGAPESSTQRRVAQESEGVPGPAAQRVGYDSMGKRCRHDGGKRKDKGGCSRQAR